MINDIFKSTNHVISERIKNPIVGSIILAWIYVNWRLIYMIFNFPDQYSYENKIEKINKFIVNNEFKLLFKPIILAFVILLSYLILSNLALIIISFFLKKIRPKIIEYFDKTQIVEREIYNDLKTNHSSSLDELETLQQNYYKIKADRDKYKNELENMEVEKLKNSTDELLKEAQNEREIMLKDAREIKSKMIEDAKNEAQEMAKQIIDQATKAIESEKSKLMDDLVQKRKEIEEQQNTNKAEDENDNEKDEQDDDENTVK